MSKTSASSPRSALPVGRSDPALFPYNEWTGTPIFRSRPPRAAAMYWMSPRTPCSGPKRAASRTPRASWNRSAACRRRRSTAGGRSASRRARRGPMRPSLDDSPPQGELDEFRPVVDVELLLGVGVMGDDGLRADVQELSLIHISEPTRLGMISYAVFCL